MKKISLICCLLIGLMPVSYARARQSTSIPVEKAKGLQKQLKLTDQQTSKIAAIYKASAEKYEKIKKSEHGNSAKMATSVGPLRAATVKKIKAVLTAEQGTKFDALIKNKNSTDWSGGWSAGPGRLIYQGDIVEAV